MYKLLGVVLMIYTVFSMFQGEIYAKSGVWGNVVERTKHPVYFWTVVLIYLALSLALLTVF